MNQQRNPQKIPDPFGFSLRRILLWSAILATVAIAGWQGWHRFLRWQENNLNQKAQAALSRGDGRSAVLYSRQALELDPRNLPATRIMAQLAEFVGSPAAVLWREQITVLEPGRDTNFLVWAATALRHDDWLTASRALGKVSREGRRTADFNRTAGAVAVAARQFSAAEMFFLNAARLEPASKSDQLNLAILGLEPAAGEKLETARAMLEKLAGEPGLRLPAVRALVNDARRRQETERALKWSAMLVDLPNLEFRDRLLRLDVLHWMHHPHFESSLETLKEMASASARQTTDLISWMNGHGLAAAALEWGARLPAERRQELPVPLAIGEALANLGRWDELREFVAGLNWRELEFYRHAILARSLREKDQPGEAREQWRLALIATGEQPGRLSQLARLVEGWRWTAETVEIWWKLTRFPNLQRDALRSLYQLYQASHDTHQLLRVSDRALENDPGDWVAKNNVAMFSLLVGQNRAKAHRLALENFNLSPTNTVFLSTRAFSLHMQGDTAGGLKLLNTVPEKLLRNPSLAAYYGILLAAQGEADKARPYLDIADKNPQLLPEEKALVAAAQRAIQQPK